jgi:hypothetical protein
MGKKSTSLTNQMFSTRHDPGHIPVMSPADVPSAGESARIQMPQDNSGNQCWNSCDAKTQTETSTKVQGNRTNVDISFCLSLVKREL